MTSKWDDYEMFVQSVCQELMGESGVHVYRLREYEGKKSRRKIKIDVSFETHLMGARVLVLCECKCYRSRVDVGEVQEFWAKFDDIGANKGMFTFSLHL
ncbi:MAG: restriction endonuclease [Pseudomonadota bacterium]